MNQIKTYKEAVFTLCIYCLVHMSPSNVKVPKWTEDDLDKALKRIRDKSLSVEKVNEI